MRKILCLLISTCIIICMGGCQSTKLSEGFDEQVIKDTAEELLNEVQLNGAKETLTKYMREDMVDNIDLDTMDNTVVNLAMGKGDFMMYSRKTVIGKYHDELEEDLGIIYVTATYEKGEINYTITFDKDMKVVGFYAN